MCSVGLHVPHYWQAILVHCDSEAKRDKGNAYAKEKFGYPELVNVLQPRTRGFVTCLSQLRGSLDAGIHQCCTVRFFPVPYWYVYVNVKNDPGTGLYVYGTIIKILHWYIGATHSIELVWNQSWHTRLAWYRRPSYIPVSYTWVTPNIPVQHWCIQHQSFWIVHSLCKVVGQNFCFEVATHQAIVVCVCSVWPDYRVQGTVPLIHQQFIRNRSIRSAYAHPSNTNIWDSTVRRRYVEVAVWLVSSKGWDVSLLQWDRLFP